MTFFKNIFEKTYLLSWDFRCQIQAQHVNNLLFLFQVTLKGAKDCVEAARNKILETVEDLESQVMIECHIEQVSFPEIL